MYKKNKHLGLKKANIRRTCRIMRVFFLCFTLGIGVCFSSNSYSQSTKISLNLKNKTVKQVLSEIEKNSEFIFFYQDDILDVDRKVTVNAENETIEQILNEILGATGNTYFVSDRSIYIIKKALEDIVQERNVVQQQKKRVSGIITDKDDEAIIGANVVEKGTTNGTVTDVDGRFSLSVESDAVIHISYIGYLSQEINTTGKTIFDVVLQEDMGELGEVVVVGYGTMKKKDLTGAVGGIREDVLGQSRLSSFVNSMQGRIAGVQITTGSGEPGSGARVIIRGANTLTGNSTPLYVIDGIQINQSDASIASSRFGTSSSKNPLSSINPADIVSIDVLKDASSTAIYGSKGANGVIIVTTRQGQEGKPVVAYDGNIGMSYRARKIEMLDGNEWIEYRKDWTLMPDKKRIVYGYFNDWLFFMNPAEMDPGKKIPRDVYSLPEYDWQDEMYRTALSTTHNLSISGGNKTTKFQGSVGYNKEEGILRNNDYSRYTTRMKLDHTQNRFIFSIGLNASYSCYSGAAQSGDGYNNMGILQTAIISRPLVFSNPLADQTQGGWKEPTTNLNYVNRVTSASNLSSNASVTYKIHEGLYIGSTVSGTIVPSKTNEFYGKETPWGYYLKGRGAITNSEWIGWANINSLSYDKIFKNKTRLNSLLVYELNGSRSESSSIIKSNFADETTGIHDISKGVTLEDATSNAGIMRRMSLLGRINYNIHDKYLITTSLRADGSDRFGEDNRWGYFPSLALAWRLSEEPFMKKLKFLDNLKIRLSYGRTGNSNIPAFQYMARMGNSFYSDELGLAPSSMPNPKLKWETTIQYNAGIDLAIVKGVIDLSVDVYNKVTTDMLYRAIIPAQSGFKTQWQNLGEINNKGIEVAINTRNINTKNFTWSSGLTMSANKNKVIDIGNGLDMAPIGAGSWSLSYIKINDVGRIMRNQPIGIIYGYEMDGIYQLDDFTGWVDKTGSWEANDPDMPWQVRSWQLKEGVTDCSAIAAPRPGTFKFKNLDGSADNKITEDDKTIIGKNQPKLYGGVSNNFRYRNFDLGIFFTYSLGGDIFNSTKFELEGAFPGEYYNITKRFWENRWTPDNPTNKYPAYSDAGYYNTLAAVPNSYYVEDASYLRLQNLSFGYSFPLFLSKRMGVSNIKVYYSVNNLFTITKYTGFTPEVDNGNALLSGFDIIGYPRTSSHVFGLNVTF